MQTVCKHYDAHVLPASSDYVVLWNLASFPDSVPFSNKWGATPRHVGTVLSGNVTSLNTKISGVHFMRVSFPISG